VQEKNEKSAFEVHGQGLAFERLEADHVDLFVFFLDCFHHRVDLQEGKNVRQDSSLGKAVL